MVSIRMMPSDVVTAQAEYSVWPTQYRLSNTFTGSAYHCERGGACLGPLDAAGDFGADGRNDVCEQTASNKPRCSWPAAALAAATCESTAPVPCCPRAVAARAMESHPPASRFVTPNLMARPPIRARKPRRYEDDSHEVHERHEETPEK